MKHFAICDGKKIIGIVFSIEDKPKESIRQRLMEQFKVPVYEYLPTLRVAKR